MKKHFVILVALFFIGAMLPTIVSAQDVIHLKDGTSVRGRIVSQRDGSVSIETRNREIRTYQISDIETNKDARSKSEPEVIRPKERKRSRNTYIPATFNKSKGYFGLVEVGGGSGDFNTGLLSLSIVNGYRVIPQFAAGIGVGVMTKFKEAMVPVFLHLRSDFLNRNVSPFVAVNIGYLYNINRTSPGNGSRHAYMVEPIVGTSFNVTKKHRMTAGAYFNYSRYIPTVTGTETMMETSISTSRDIGVGLKVGFSF